MNNNDYIDYDLCKPKIIQRKYTDFTSSLHHPDITMFKKINNFRSHSNYFKKTKEYPLELIHIMKPKSKNKYYINMIKKLYNIDEVESIKKIKKFNGNIYDVIIYG